MYQESLELFKCMTLWERVKYYTMRPIVLSKGFHW
jgi:hypothetical protein